MTLTNNLEIENFKPECNTCTALCCRNIPNEYQNICLSGTSICKLLDQITNKCTIYQERPLICNVTKTYETDLILQSQMNKEEWYKLNYNACEELKNV